VDIKAQLLPVKMPDLISFVRSTMGIIARQKEVELRFDANDWGDEFEFNSDRHLLELVLKNLVENSIKFTPSGGTVTVRLARTSGTIVMEVIDTGIGIPPEHQERVFERFYQVDAARSGSAGRGTGLGLAIVKHAIHALGGSVQLASEVGRGTTVMCLLPIVPAQEEQVVITQSVQAGG
jgi:signal transduction histidine kinase